MVEFPLYSRYPQLETYPRAVGNTQCYDISEIERRPFKSGKVQG
jgi:hypothetical protein